MEALFEITKGEVHGLVTDDFLKSIENNRLHLDCSSIVLTQDASHESPVVYNGPGTIYQEDENRFIVKVFCQGKTDIRTALGSINRLVPGRLVDDNEYYSLRATDIKGGTWTAASIMPKIHASFHGEGFLVMGDFSVLQFREEDSLQRVGTSIRLFYKGKHDVPCNTPSVSKRFIGDEERGSSSALNVAQFAIGDIQFEILSEDDWLIVYFYSKHEDMNKITAQRVHEALQFVLAKTVPWSILDISKENAHETTVRAVGYTGQKSKAQPPFHFSTVDTEGNVWKLFERFFTYCSDYKEPDWHPLFDYVHQVVEAGKASMEAYALTLTVSVEGLLKLAFRDVALPGEEFLHKLEDAQGEIDNSKISEDVKRRIRGALEPMKNPRAIDRLKYLVDEGVVDQRLVRSWKRVRNSSAHSDPIDLSRFQELIDDCYAVYVLFNQLIFHVIEYDGQYTDYSVHGFPTGKYELKRP